MPLRSWSGPHFPWKGKVALHLVADTRNKCLPATTHPLGLIVSLFFNKEGHPVRIQSLASIILNLKVGQDVAVGRTRVSLRCFTSSDGLSAIFTHTSGETYFQAASSATRTEASSWMLCQAYSILLPGCILPKWQRRTGHKPATQLCSPSMIHG